MIIRLTLLHPDVETAVLTQTPIEVEAWDIASLQSFGDHTVVYLPDGEFNVLESAGEIDSMISNGGVLPSQKLGIERNELRDWTRCEGTFLSKLIGIMRALFPTTYVRREFDRAAFVLDRVVEESRERLESAGITIRDLSNRSGGGWTGCYYLWCRRFDARTKTEHKSVATSVEISYWQPWNAGADPKVRIQWRRQALDSCYDELLYRDWDFEEMSLSAFERVDLSNKVLHMLFGRRYDQHEASV